MAIAILQEFPDMNPEQASAILEALDLAGKSPSGQLFHVDGPMADGGVRVVDVWESQEAFDSFLRDTLMPAFGRAGVQVGPPTTTVWPVSHLLQP